MRLIGKQREERLNISKRIGAIDVIAEGGLLTMSEWEERIELENQLENLVRMDEAQWKQRARKIGFFKEMPIPSFSINLLMGEEGKVLLPIYIQIMGRLGDNKILLIT